MLAFGEGMAHWVWHITTKRRSLTLKRAVTLGAYRPARSDVAALSRRYETSRKTNGFDYGSLAVRLSRPAVKSPRMTAIAVHGDTGSSSLKHGREWVPYWTLNAVIVCRISGKKQTTDSLRRGMLQSVRAAFPDGQLIQPPLTTAPLRRQTDNFRPGTQGIGPEVDFVFRV